ncbi:MAG TPA: RiPP maturation radical SAM C-methyltransferase [Blastocatellia bacterium]|nr:RiPP maturation radical SAM C-methyltransferase [Blastocatellia bacterium]
MRINLINMPFANLSLPSIALTQLNSVLEDSFGAEVRTRIVYVNHDFARYLGLPLYRYLTNSADSHNSGLGDWFFRPTAFPGVDDNAEAYFKRYYPQRTPQVEGLKRLLVEKRRGIDSFLGQVMERYRLDEADITGFTSMFMQNTASFSMAAKLKAHNAAMITLMGGANCESPMGQEIAKNVSNIDFVFSGPGLRSLVEFVRYCIDGEVDKCHGIRGVLSKRNYAFQTGPGAIGEELSIDEPVRLDYSGFLSELEQNFSGEEVEPTLPFETSRGCWWGERAHCTFCGLNGLSMAYRAMEPERALNLLNSLFEYSGRVTKLEAVDNILPKSYLHDVLPRLSTPANMSIFYEVKADLSEEDVQTLSKSRVKKIQPGIESLATSTLKLMKKGTSVFQNLSLLKNCAIYGIEPSWNLLVGFPGEGEDVYKKYTADIPLLLHLPPPSGVYPVRFDRYSPYFVRAAEYKLELRPLDFYGLVYPFEKDALINLAYYFADATVGASYMTEMVKWIGKVREKVGPWLVRWNSAASGQAAPRLHFKDGSATTVYDSRSGEVVEHEIGQSGRQILDQLSKPGRIEDLTRELGRAGAFDAEKEVTILRDKGLVFEENGRFMSLVLKSATAVLR